MHVRNVKKLNEVLHNWQHKKPKKISADPLIEKTINGLCYKVMVLPKLCEESGKGEKSNGQNGENEKNREKSEEKGNPPEQIPLIWWPGIAGC